MEKPPDHVKNYVVVTLGYEHRYRKVFATSVTTTKSGKTLITGWDPDANEGEGGYRSFRVDRLNGEPHIQD